MLRARPLARLSLICLAAFMFGQAFAQDANPVHGIFEQYLETDPAHKGVQGTMSYLGLNVDPAPNLHFFASYLELPNDRWIDELFGELDSGANILKIGRFRPAFGFSNWSELYYTPFIGVPMIRSYGTEVASNLSLDRRDRGIDFEGGSPSLQYQIAAVDSSDDAWHVAPSKLDTGIARLQLSEGPIMVGLNGLAKAKDAKGPAGQIAGIDFRWTASHTQVRGELIKGLGTRGETGYYVDLLYRPPGLERTQLGARIQGIDAQSASAYGSPWPAATDWGQWSAPTWTWAPPASSPGKFKGSLYTLAARQFLSENFTLNVNYGAGSNIPLAEGLRGWSVQLMSSFRF